MVGGAGGDGYNIISAGTQSGASAGTIVFSNSNNVSFGMSNSSIVTASATMAQSTQPVAVSGSNGSFLFSTMTLGSSNGMHFYTTNGSVVGSYTVPAQSNQTIGVYLSSQTTGAASSTTVDARSFTIAGMGNISVGASAGSIVLSGSGGAGGGIAASANGASVSAGTVVWSNSNNVSFGMNVSTITASATFAQSNQAGSVYAADSTFGTSSGTYDARTLSIKGSGLVSVAASNSGFIIQVAPARSLYASSNTFGTSSGTYDDRTLSIAGSGLVSVAASNGGWVISVPTTQQRSLYASSNTFGTSSGTYNDGTLSIAGSGAVSVAASNSGWVISAPAQTNQTVGLYAVGSTTLSSSATADARSLSFYGSGNVYVAATNGSVLIAQTGGAGGDGFNIIQMSGGNSYGTANTYASATMALYAAANISLSQSSNTISIIGPAGGAAATVSAWYNNDLGASSTLNNPQNSLFIQPLTLYSAVSASTMIVGMLSLSGTITSAATAQAGITMQAAIYSQNATNSTRFDTLWTEGESLTQWNSGTSSGSYAFSGTGGNTTSSSAGSNLLTASLMGVRMIKMNPAQIFTTGQYLFAFRLSTSSAGYSAALSRRALYVNNPNPVGMGTIGEATATSLGFNSGLYSVTTGGIPASIGLSELRVNSNCMPWFSMGAV